MNDTGKNEFPARSLPSDNIPVFADLKTVVNILN